MVAVTGIAGSVGVFVAVLALAFRITPDLLLLGLAFALATGVLGGLPPAVRAARANVAAALRAL